MNRGRWSGWGSVLALALVAGCDSMPPSLATPTHLVTYGAQGTEIQSERLVGQFLGKDVWPLPYGGPNIAPPLERMRARFPELRAELDRGTLGVTDDGEIAVHPIDADTSATVPNETNATLFALARAENRDRQLFYIGLSIAVGHGSEDLYSWLGFVKATFGAEWQKQAPSGWWLRDEKGQWRRQP